MMPLLIPATAFAHARMMSPVPRSNSDALKDPNGPCGVTRTAAQPVTNPPLVPGASLMVTWTETITHPGCYIVDFSASGDTGWTTLTTLAHRGTGPYNTMVTLPTTPCSACTLRVRQIMLGSEPAAGATCPPANLASGSTYYSCANVVLGAGGASGSGGASGTGGAGAGTGGRAGGTGGAAGRGTGGQSGTGGTVGTGGRANTGGTPATTGGAPGTGGMTTTSTGGAVGSGGAPVTTGTGGAPITGTGGAAPTGTGGAGTGIDDAEPPACACGITGSSSLSATAMLFGVLLGLAVRRGRGRARKPKAANQKP